MIQLRLTKLKDNQDAFTLAELLVVMLVVSILAIAMANFIVTWLQQSELSQARTNLLLNAQTSMDTITNDIQLSGSVDTSNRWADANSPSGQYGWTAGTQTLVLAKIATDKSNNVIFSDPANYISLKDNEVYFLSGTTLYRRTIDSTNASDAAVTTCPAAKATHTCPVDTTIATGVSSLSFVYYDGSNNVVTAANARSVQTAITLTTKVNSQVINESYTTRMVFRNE